MAPDLILANSTPVTGALREQSHSVPTVFTQVTDPVGQGLVPNLAHPSGNLTGFTSFEFSIGTKWLEALKQIAPRVTRVALAFDPKSAPFADLFLGPVVAAAPSFSVTPIAAPVRAAADVDHVFDALAREPNSSVMVLPDISMTNHREAIIALAARHRVPAVYPFRYFAASGGLMSYGTDVAEVFRRAAGYVDRILKGTSPGELPIQAPTKYELVINLKTAKASASKCRRRCSPAPTRSSNEAARVHHAARRRGGGVALRSAGAAAGQAAHHWVIQKCLMQIACFFFA